MSEMEERVAEVIWTETERGLDIKGNPTGEWPRDAESCLGGADGFRRVAREAIKAMREPTEAMVAAGWADPADAWPSMIDTALK